MRASVKRFLKLSLSGSEDTLNKVINRARSYNLLFDKQTKNERNKAKRRRKNAVSN